MCAFPGGIDSGSVFLTTYHVMLKLGMNPSRLKAFVLDLGDGPDVAQARAFLEALGLALFLEPSKRIQRLWMWMRPSGLSRTTRRLMCSQLPWRWRYARGHSTALP